MRNAINIVKPYPESISIKINITFICLKVHHYVIY